MFAKNLRVCFTFCQSEIEDYLRNSRYTLRYDLRFYPIDWRDLFQFRDFSGPYVTEVHASTDDKTRAITFRILLFHRCNEPLIFLLPCYMDYPLRTYLFMP